MKNDYPWFKMRKDLNFTITPATPPERSEQRAAINAMTATDGNASPAVLRGIAEGALMFLASKARNGDSKALWELATLTHQLCEGLSNMTRENPGAMKAVARDCGR